MENKDKVILDLCGGTGSWAKPYKEAGYQVITLTLPDGDVTDINKDTASLKVAKAIELVRDNKVYGILAAPPCTQFSFARTNAKKLRDFEGAMDIVYACFKFIWTAQATPVSNTAKYTNLKFWALENPYFGLLKNFIGNPVFTFDPWEFGDGYQKRTALWGNFKEPVKTPIPMTKEAKAKTNSHLHTIKFDYLKSKDIHPESFGVLDRQARRAITPQGFAQAFFKANQ